MYEASAEVGRLEAEIRFVVEGRQRVEQRLNTLKEQTAQWAMRKEQALQESETLAEQGLDADEKEELLSAQVEEQAGQLPELEEALRQAQNKANEQRSSVGQVQQQIQVLAADQRNIEDQSRQLNTRHERLTTDRNALSAPDEQRLVNLQTQLASAQEAQQEAEAPFARIAGRGAAAGRCTPHAAAVCQHRVPQNTPSLSARMDALKALQDKVKTDGKLSPGWSSMAWKAWRACGAKIHIEQGWENALEGALRERLGALEVSRLDMVRGLFGRNGRGCTTAKLAFYSPPQAGLPSPANALPRLADLLRLHDAGQKALLNDWLHGLLHPRRRLKKHSRTAPSCRRAR